ncbi:ABC transporter permease [Inquilinus sp. CA228]|uniref:ABC transporter permease n=1 Tax=Inquilinus sp. CA228 TaxID=3455609 RepID=UPI003F8D4F23
MSDATLSPGRDFAHPRFLGIRVRPITARRIANFRANRRGLIALYVFLAVFLVTLFAEFIANDRPLLVKYDGHYYVPILATYPETAFGGEFETEADYRDPFVRELISAKGWAVWPLIPFSYRTINYDLDQPAPSPPSEMNWLGTDDQGRDVLARLIYGLRLSILFGITLTFFSTIIGVAAGAVQGYFGGWIDLIFQRAIEVWSGMPQLYLLIIMSSIFAPGFWTLLIIFLLFEWMSLVGVVRAEFLRARNLDYVRAARALGQPDRTIMRKHVLPNAVVATITFLPFNLTGSIGLLTALDFLGFGLPAGSPSLGELVNQGKANLQAPWLGFTAFFSLAILLSLLVFMGEALRDAFDPRKTLAAGASRPAADPVTDPKAQTP